MLKIRERTKQETQNNTGNENENRKIHGRPSLTPSKLKWVSTKTIELMINGLTRVRWLHPISPSINGNKTVQDSWLNPAITNPRVTDIPL